MRLDLELQRGHFLFGKLLDYSHQAGIGEMSYKDQGPGYRGELRRNVRTLPEILKALGIRHGDGRQMASHQIGDDWQWPKW